MRTCWIGLFTLAAGLSAFCCAKSIAEEPKEEEAPAKIKFSAAAQAVEDVTLGYQLVEYGRRTKSPEALITAAKIFGEINSLQPAKREGDQATAPDEATRAATKNAPASQGPASPEDLLKEALKLSDSESVAALVKDARRQISESKKGEIDGPQRNFGYVERGRTSVWNTTMRGNQIAVVTVSPAGLDVDPVERRRYESTEETRPDWHDYSVQIQDSSGRVITSARGQVAVCRWYPTSTRTYRIVIRDYGSGGEFQLNNN